MALFDYLAKFLGTVLHVLEDEINYYGTKY